MLLCSRRHLVHSSTGVLGSHLRTEDPGRHVLDVDPGEGSQTTTSVCDDGQIPLSRDISGGEYLQKSGGYTLGPFYESKSAAIPVATKIHPLRNSAGIVTEWITQYRSDVKISVNGLSPVDILTNPATAWHHESRQLLPRNILTTLGSTPQFRGTPLLKIFCPKKEPKVESEEVPRGLLSHMRLEWIGRKILKSLSKKWSKK